MLLQQSRPVGRLLLPHAVRAVRSRSSFRAIKRGCFSVPVLTLSLPGAVDHNRAEAAARPLLAERALRRGGALPQSKRGVPCRSVRHHPRASARRIGLGWARVCPSERSLRKPVPRGAVLPCDGAAVGPSAAVMIHSLFLINASGDIFLEKHWKSVVSRSVCDYFFEAQERASEAENVPPVISTPHHYLLSVYRHKIFFVAVIQTEVPPLFVIEFLHRVVDTFQVWLTWPGSAQSQCGADHAALAEGRVGVGECRGG